MARDAFHGDPLVAAQKGDGAGEGAVAWMDG